MNARLNLWTDVPSDCHKTVDESHSSIHSRVRQTGRPENRMSKKETPITRQYWKCIGGTLIEEFPAVKGGPENGARLVDAVIIPGGPFEIRLAGSVELRGKDIVVVQTKASRLGMYLLGQALFSRRLMEPFRPSSIRSVALCTKGDAVLEPLASEYGIEVVVIPAAEPVAPA
jgi:hypothetical protein